MRRISVSELTTFADCRRKHGFKYGMNISLVGETDSRVQAGSLVHGAVQSYVKLRDGRPLADHVITVAEQMVMAGQNKAKLIPAVKKALGHAKNFPQDRLDDPALISEYPVEWQVYPDNRSLSMSPPTTTGGITIWGIPDLIYCPAVDEIEVWELKTTDNAYKHPLDFLLYNPQHRYYATMLKVQMPELTVSFRYIVLGPKGLNEQTFLFTDTAFELTKKEIRGIIESLDGKEYPNFRTSCGWCEFRMLCVGRMLGQNEKSLIAENYRKREKH